LDDALRRARTANRLANKYSVQVEPRLSAGQLPQLQADRVTLGDAAARGATALGQQKTGTSKERATSAQGHAFVMSIRNAVARTSRPPAALRTAIGIGDGLKAEDTQGVVAALRAIADHGVALAQCGVVPDDVTAASALAAELLGADGTQGTLIDARAEHTEDRVDTQLRVEGAVDEISARGALAFYQDPVIAERFRRLVAVGGPTADDEADAGPEPTPPPVGGSAS
jgi:hypothetical protein